MRRQRTGFTVIEMVVSTVLMAAALGTIVHLVGHVHTHVRIDRRRAAVGQALDAAMETLVAQGYRALALGTGRTVPVPVGLPDVVPQLRLVASVEQAAPNLKTVTLEATWPAWTGGRTHRARLKTQLAPRGPRGGAP